MYIRGCRAAKEFRRSEEFCSGGGRVMPEIGGTHYLKMIRDTPKADGKISGGSSLRNAGQLGTSHFPHIRGQKPRHPVNMSLYFSMLDHYYLSMNLDVAFNGG